MPIFKTTKNIFQNPWEDELFDQNWMDSDKLILPLKKSWDYSRELTVEEVDIWEVLYEGGGGFGVYAAWEPYAEFYIIKNDFQGQLESFYGKKASEKLYKKCIEMDIPIFLKKVWVDPEDMWLYS
jgi:hypothetical protein